MVEVILNAQTRSCIPSSNFLGYEGENGANKLVFNFSNGFVDGSAQLNIKRENDNGYVALVKVGETYELEVKSSLVSKIGEITFQLQVSKADGTIYKFDTFIMTVKDAIDTDVPLPEEYPSWQETIATALAEMENLNIYATKIDDVTTVSVTDKKGTITEVEIHDGKDGKDGVIGQDGVSPTVETEQTLEGAKITITDVNGVHIAEVLNGKDGTMSFEELTDEQKASLKGDPGTPGKPGVEGYSPTANVSQTSTGATITITDKNGTTTANVVNGKDGSSGADGQPGKDGVTPHIGDNGNWWLGDTDTGVSAGGSGGSATLPDRAYFNYDKSEEPVTNTFLPLTNTSLRGIELDASGNPILKAGKTYKITLSLYKCNIANKSTNRFVLSKTKSDGTKNNVSFIYPPSAASAGGQGQNLSSSVCVEVATQDFSLQIWAIHATVENFVTTGCTSLAFDLMIDEVV